MRTASRIRFLFLLVMLIGPYMVEAIWFPWYFHRYGLQSHSERHQGPPIGGGGGGGVAPGGGGGRSKAPPPPPSGAKKPGGGGVKTTKPSHLDKATCPPGYQQKTKANSTLRLCDDNPILLQLARLYVVSPERIMLLVAQPSILDSCNEINDVLDHISASTRNCRLTDDNIYGKLSEGLDYFKLEICDGGDGSTRKRCAGINEAHNCIRELRTDMVECEGPADWYEERNSSKLCQMFNDILDCYYTRTALLCGLKPARQLRSLAADTIKRGLIFPCLVNNRLPLISDPMPAGAEKMVKNLILILTMPQVLCNVFG